MGLARNNSAVFYFSNSVRWKKGALSRAKEFGLK